MARHRRGRNEGTIRERADGRWEARLKGEDGKYKVHYARTSAEVQDWLIDKLKARKDGLQISGRERQTIGSVSYQLAGAHSQADDPAVHLSRLRRENPGSPYPRLGQGPAAPADVADRATVTAGLVKLVEDVNP